jgi:hypothetical protein
VRVRRKVEELKKIGGAWRTEEAKSEEANSEEVFCVVCVVVLY